ncbi:beta-1 adrenergic receptor-like [Patiria miniata]|uniref:G-protein coupled receptors family 1 profile domain-containing protein n=1 Tax=Patiria miniata TaxID=46514 RepID=A0A914B6U5_PATMI|nr:beta-1 adrenergic receptor-like [Patiria miniata]
MDASSAPNVTRLHADGAFALDKSLWYNLSLIVLIVLGSVGNGLCFYAVVRYKFLRTVPNFHVTSLAVSDLFVCVLVLPLTVYNGLRTGEWNLGGFMCHLWPFFASVGSLSCKLTLCVISVDRYLSIAAPVKYLKYRKPRIALAVITATWLAVFVTSSPLISLTSRYRGSECFPTETIFDIRATLAVCLFVLPTCVLVVVNVGTARAIWKINRPRRIGPGRNPDAPGIGNVPAPNQRDVQASVLKMQQKRSETPGCSTHRSTPIRYPAGLEADDATMANIPGPSSSKEPQRVASSAAVAAVTVHVNRRQQRDTDPRPNQQPRIEDILAARRKTSFAVIAVVVGSYIVCWLPFFSIILYSKQHPEVYQTPVAPWPLVASRWLGFLNSTINPIIYASMKRDYKRAMKMMLRCRRA